MLDTIEMTTVGQNCRYDIRSYASLEPIHVMIKLYKESRKGVADALAAPREVPGHLLYRPAPGELMRLPQPIEQSRPLYQAMVERTSLRFYDEKSVSQAQLATILHTASTGDRQDWPQEGEAGIPLQFLLVAWRVEDLAPAVYRYEQDEHALVYVGPAPNQKEGGANLVLQTEFGDAPLIVLITGNLAAACARHGAWGHRLLLLRAGAAGQRMWLSSIGVGLVGTTFAGFLPRAAHRIAGVDGYKNASLFAYSTGYLHPDYILSK
ncbi:MAG TPA: nitroreductase family protein [Ktedonobacteraceae bacterium]|nr:nitroreductase family protein [Ktedonobacteraceae bacterium]